MGEGQAAGLFEWRGEGPAILGGGDRGNTWRIFYRLDPDAVVIAGVAQKKTQRTPKAVLDACKRRLAQYDRDYWKETES